MNSPGEKKKFLLKLYLSSKRLFLPTRKHVDERQDTGGLKTITEESAPLLLKQLDTLCQAEPAKAEIPGSSNRANSHPSAPVSHIPLSYSPSLHPFQKSNWDMLSTISTWLS